MVHIYEIYVDVFRAFTSLVALHSGYCIIPPKDKIQYVKEGLQKNSSRWDKDFFQLLERIRKLYNYKLKCPVMPDVFMHLICLAKRGWNWSEVSVLYQLSWWQGPHDSCCDERSDASAGVFFNWLRILNTDKPPAIEVPLRWCQLTNSTTNRQFNPNESGRLSQLIMSYAKLNGKNMIDLFGFIWTVQWAQLNPIGECLAVCTNDFASRPGSTRRPWTVSHPMVEQRLHAYYDPYGFNCGSQNQMLHQYKAIQIERILGRWRLMLVPFYFFWTQYMYFGDDMVVLVLQQMGFEESVAKELYAWLYQIAQTKLARGEFREKCAKIERTADLLCPRRWKRPPL